MNKKTKKVKHTSVGTKSFYRRERFQKEQLALKMASVFQIEHHVKKKKKNQNTLKEVNFHIYLLLAMFNDLISHQNLSVFF